MVKCAEHGQYDHFGESALVLDDDVWPHTVETKEETIFVVLTKADYRRTCQAEFERPSIGGEAVGDESTSFGERGEDSCRRLARLAPEQQRSGVKHRV